MPATTAIQKAAFDAIDTLHFNQVVMSLICGEPIAEWYPKILSRIDRKLSEAEIRGAQAVIARHYLLAALEIHLSFDEKFQSVVTEYAEELGSNSMVDGGLKCEKFSDFALNFSFTIFCKVAENNGVDQEFLVQTIEELMNDKSLELSSMPYLIRYRFTESCYALEYPDAPLDFYRELVSFGIIPCKKYSKNIDSQAKKTDSNLSSLFIRAGLLFEFKMLQRAVSVMMSLQKNDTIYFPELDLKLSNTERKNISSYYKQIIDDWVFGKVKNSFVLFVCKKDTSRKDAELLLKKISKYYLHKRIFCGTQGSWLGTLGAYDIEVHKSEEPKVAIYYSMNNIDSISEKIRLKFLKYGFCVSARSLYLRHRGVKDDGYSNVRYYFSNLLSQQYMIPWCFNNNCYDIFKYK